MLVIARIDFGFWLRRVVTWDALLPIVIWVAPSVIEVLLPNRRGAMEIAALVLPIAAVFLRFRAGMRHIASNRCSRLVRGVQVAVFMVGMLPLILFDCFMILSHNMPALGPMPAEDVIVWSILLSIYVTAMVIAMYPGRLVDDNPYCGSLESPRPAELEGRQWQPPWAFFALVISCIICGALAAAMPRHEPMRDLIAWNSVFTGSGALALLLRSLQTRAVARKSDNRQRPPADPAPAPETRRMRG
ncbi:MAG TPA: hypothetical protein VNH11_28185 [Pirellulales bacterium]|nr:hypothetical protein [Pirellulales bacterium]